jgi:hypothetical protein
MGGDETDDDDDDEAEEDDAVGSWRRGRRLRLVWVDAMPRSLLDAGVVGS